MSVTEKKLSAQLITIPFGVFVGEIVLFITRQSGLLLFLAAGTSGAVIGFVAGMIINRLAEEEGKVRDLILFISRSR